MENLKVTLVQTELIWENATANLAMLEEKLAQVDEETDLIILPEMFNSGFTMATEKIAEPMNLTTTKWMKQMAKQYNCVIVGSFIVKEKTEFNKIANYNRLLWVEQNGHIESYDKRHLFRMGNEHLKFQAGNKKLIKELNGWKICPLICYDLRFPVWSRNVNLEYDLLLYIANWPNPRAKVWKTLLEARALENQCFVAGVNRIGADGMGLNYNGDTAMIDYKGNKIVDCEAEDCIKTITLSKSDLDDFRTKFPAYLDADIFEINT